MFHKGREREKKFEAKEDGQTVRERWRHQDWRARWPGLGPVACYDQKSFIFLRSSFANEECLRSYNEKREVLELCSQGIAGNLMKWLINTYK